LVTRVSVQFFIIVQVDGSVIRVVFKNGESFAIKIVDSEGSEFTGVRNSPVALQCDQGIRGTGVGEHEIEERCDPVVIMEHAISTGAGRGIFAYSIDHDVEPGLEMDAVGRLSGLASDEDHTDSGLRN